MQVKGMARLKDNENKEQWKAEVKKKEMDWKEEPKVRFLRFQGRR